MQPTVACGDSLPWLAAQPGQAARTWAVITSLPDANELGLAPGVEWRSWFVQAAVLCMEAALPAHPAVFFQTDRKAGGAWHSKAALLMEAAQLAYGTPRLLWHRIVLRRAPGKVDLHRPGYSHLMAFSCTGGPGKAQPDVIAPSRSLYANGMPVAAAYVAAAHVRACAPGAYVVDPFCGRGTVLLEAARHGLRAHGIDNDPAQVAHAMALLRQ